MPASRSHDGRSGGGVLPWGPAGRLVMAVALLATLAAPAGAQTAAPAAPATSDAPTQPPAASAAPVADGDWRHGSALFGELRYGPDATHYEHANPDAPKGGTLNQAAFGGYDSFNPFVVRGRASAGLSPTGGVLWDTLMDQAVDQPSASYGLVAESFRFPPDFSSATYRLDARARFHDGKAITPEDVIWTLEQLKAHSPFFAQYFRNVTGAEASGEREVTFRFDIKGNRELPQILGDMPVLPKHWWTGNGPDGQPRTIAEPTAEIPLGSGPYRIASFDLGRSVTFERVPDYWAADTLTRKGRYNFGTLRYTYFLDDNAIWEAFKKGGIADTRSENRSARWATEYNFPAFQEGRVKRAAFSTSSGEPFQAYFMNTRRPVFADPRVRQALALLFDFESMNRTLFYGLYTRTDSYFEGGELAHRDGPAEGRVREILETYRGRIPDAAIEADYALPDYTKADPRTIQRQALALFRAAGYRFEGGRMLDAAGNQVTFEILGNDATDERVGLPAVDYFRRLGIVARLRIVDDAQYKARVDAFDFDMVMLSTQQSQSPGNEQREFWSSAAAKASGSRNYAGIADPVVDELVETIIAAPDRDELVALTRALDRVLLNGWYAIPMWHNPEVWFAWWDKLAMPQTQPEYTGVDIWSWWVDPAKAGQ